MKRRKRVRELHAQGLTYRQIAAELGVSTATIHKDLHYTEPERVPARRYSWPPFEAGNAANLRHGTRSERRIAPVRERHARDLAERYPWIDPARIALQAQRLAQIDLASAWLDEQGTVVRDSEGSVFDVADKLARWLVQAEQWFDRAEGERREQGRYDALADFMSDDDEGVGDGSTAS